MKKIGVFVSGGGTNLQALIDGIKEGGITNAEIAVVLSSKGDNYALKRAEDNAIPCEVVLRKNFPDKNDFSVEVERKIAKYNLDLIVLAGFLSVMSADFTDKYAGMMINVHPALIPAFCGDGYYGLKVHKRVLARGVKVSGATVHFANGVTDGGPIILQRAVDVLQNDTPESLQQRIMEECEQPILKEAVNLFCNDRLTIKNNRVLIDAAGR